LAPALGVAAVLALAPASAFGGVPTTLQATGLAEPAGAIVDPAGTTWVADGAGFCPLVAAAPAGGNGGGGAAAAVPFQLDSTACLGGTPLNPAIPNAPGPDAPGQPAYFDATPSAPNSGDEVVFVPDGASASSDLDVLQWDPAQRTFSLKKTITLHNTRPTSASVGPDGNVYVAFQASPTFDIERVSAPLSASPAVDVVGHSDSGTVAAGYDASGAVTLYTAEDTIMQLHPDAAAQPAAAPAPFSVGDDGAGAPRPIGALYYDVHDHALYAGTTEGLPPGTDVVDRFNTDSGVAEMDYATGLDLIGGLGTDPLGNLFVSDGAKADQLTLARDTVAPATPVITGVADGATVGAAPTFGFASPTDGGAAWTCSLDGGAFAPCSAGQPFAFSSNGTHTLSVKATDRAGNVSAASAPISFTVKRAVAPAPAGPQVAPKLAPAVAPVTLSKPARRLSYRLAGRNALRVSVALGTRASRVVSLRLYRLSGRHKKLVGSKVARTSGKSLYRATVRVPSGLIFGRYRLEARTGTTARTLKPLSTLALSIRR